ncbi:MAG: hypothetical protein ABEJ91_03670 [Candidatus Nanohaloarchaea archaeon]
MSTEEMLESPELDDPEIERMKEHLTDMGEDYDDQFEAGGYIVELDPVKGAVKFESMDGRESSSYSSWSELRKDLEEYGVI